MNGNGKISTHNISRDGAESIQWNWKLFGCSYTPTHHNSITNPFNGIESLGITPPHVYIYSWLKNPFNGIERCFNNPLTWATTWESIQWNWKLFAFASKITISSLSGIHSMELKANLSNRPRPPDTSWIHSMELKACYYDTPNDRPGGDRNPFNGIER